MLKKLTSVPGKLINFGIFIPEQVLLQRLAIWDTEGRTRDGLTFPNVTSSFHLLFDPDLFIHLPSNTLNLPWLGKVKNE